MPAVDEAPDPFGTETMAELCARQGRAADAIAIYRRLIERADGDRRARLARRLGSLELTARDVPAATPPAPAAAAAPAQRLPLVVRQPVRSGQLVRAEGGDLIVLAPVNPGAQLVADGNIHVYAALRGCAIAGARGCADARVFCQRLEAELVVIDGVYVTFEDLPPERRGKPAHIFRDGDRCVVVAIP